MRITESQLKRIIRQEAQALRSGRPLHESRADGIENIVQEVLDLMMPNPMDVATIKQAIETGDAELAMETLTLIVGAAEDDDDPYTAGLAMDVMAVLPSMSDAEIIRALSRVPAFAPARRAPGRRAPVRRRPAR